MILRRTVFVAVLLGCMSLVGCSDQSDPPEQVSQTEQAPPPQPLSPLDQLDADIDTAIAEIVANAVVQDSIRVKGRPLRIGLIPLPLRRSRNQPGVLTDLGGWLTDRIENSYSAQNASFTVSLKGDAVRAILSNHEIEATDLYDRATVQDLGHFAGTDALFAGYYRELRMGGETIVEIYAKTINTKTAQLLGRNLTFRVPRSALPESF